jgi:hypothetical protein
VLTALISFGMHYQHFPKDLISMHVWRQTQTQSTIDNFFEEDMNILNPRRNERGNGDGIFRMEFPLMQWLVALTYTFFGQHLIITRISMFLVGLLSVLGMFHLFRSIFRNETVAIIGAWAFNFSPSFYYHTLNPLPDNLALCCSIWGLVFFFQWHRARKLILLYTSALFIGIGALCKLPFILYFCVPFVYILHSASRTGLTKNIRALSIAMTTSIILPLSWYIAVIPGWESNPIVAGILDNGGSLVQWLDYLQHNLISTLPELLINYAAMPLFLLGLFTILRDRPMNDFRFKTFATLGIVLIAYYLFESNAIAKVHDYYLFPFYPVLFASVAYGGGQLINSDRKWKRYSCIFLMSIMPLTCYLRMQTRWDLESPGFNKDLLEHKDDLRHAIPNDALVVVGNDESHFIFLYYVDKKGWAFSNDDLNPLSLDAMIKNGAGFIYTDSKKVLADPELNKRFARRILTRGGISVLQLRSTNP